MNSCILFLILPPHHAFESPACPSWTWRLKVHTIQLCLSHMLVRLCSKSFKLGFSNMWTNNIQMYKLGLETLMYRTGLWTLWERERVGRFGRMALNHVKCHVWNEMPVQVQKKKKRKGRGTRDQIANICWIMEKTKMFQKNIYFCFLDYAKAFDCVDHNKLWKILKQMELPGHFTCLLRILYVGQKVTESVMEQMTASTDCCTSCKSSTRKLYIVSLLI